jgi:hypothetical protein
VKRGCDLLILIRKKRSKDRSLVSLDSSYNDGSWQLAVGSWQLAVGSWQLAVGNRQSAISNQQSAISNQQSAVR